MPMPVRDNTHTHTHRVSNTLAGLEGGCQLPVVVVVVVSFGQLSTGENFAKAPHNHFPANLCASPTRRYANALCIRRIKRKQHKNAAKRPTDRDSCTEGEGDGDRGEERPVAAVR